MFGTDGKRLDSWKEIADYLGRDVRTAKTWEGEKFLPVHRVPGGERRAVFAYSDEIDAWLLHSDRTSEGSPANLRDSVDYTNPVSPLPQGSIQEQEDAPTPTADPARKRLLSWLRSQAAVVLILLVAASAITLLALHSRNRPHAHSIASVLTAQFPTPVIDSVTPIRAQPDQTIVIRGHGLGVQAPYSNTDTPYLAIRDHSAHWAAGRIIPENWDEVMLSVDRWADSEIVVTGFGGSYGAHGWNLRPNDEIEIAVWNPQTGAGPTFYHTAVVPPSR